MTCFELSSLVRQRGIKTAGLSSSLRALALHASLRACRSARAPRAMTAWLSTNTLTNPSTGCRARLSHAGLSTSSHSYRMYLSMPSASNIKWPSFTWRGKKKLRRSQETFSSAAQSRSSLVQVTLAFCNATSSKSVCTTSARLTTKAKTFSADTWALWLISSQPPITASQVCLRLKTMTLLQRSFKELLPLRT